MLAAMYCPVIFKYLKNYISVITVIVRPFSLGNLVVFLFSHNIWSLLSQFVSLEHTENKDFNDIIWLGTEQPMG